MRKTGTKEITVEEAINTLLSLQKMTFYPTEAIAIDMAIDALEKQIPKSPDEDYEETLDGEYFNGYKCPACKHHIDYGGAYCSRCGQALDWEEEE